MLLQNNPDMNNVLNLIEIYPCLSNVKMGNTDL